MRRICIRVAYDGTDYHGWQIQNNANTIEAELNRALSEMLKEQITVIGASRTDAGVHALGNVAVFDTNARIPVEKIPIAVNGWLPADIRVVSAQEVDSDWHPRHQNCRKTYEYSITVGEIENPLTRRTAYFTYRMPDLEKMRNAAKLLEGEHDFAAFCAAGSQAESTVRTIYEISVRKEPLGQVADEMVCTQLTAGERYVIRVTGNGFLYNMVRILAGTILEAGCGRKEPEEIMRALQEGDRRLAGPTLPACGLCLMGYQYD